jgi:hypothetical protein
MLPAELILNGAERLAVEEHLSALREMMELTPENNQSLEKATLAIVTKMLLALPSDKRSEAAGEAKAEAYMTALEDVPTWAVNSATRGWYRGQYGSDHDYTWQPGPTVLRQLAFFEKWKIGRQIRMCGSSLGRAFTSA